MKIINNMLSYLNLLCTLFSYPEDAGYFSLFKQGQHPRGVLVRPPLLPVPPVGHHRHRPRALAAAPHGGARAARVAGAEAGRRGHCGLQATAGLQATHNLALTHISDCRLLISISRRSGFCRILAETDFVNYS